MKLETVALDKVKPYEGNAKEHPREQLVQIAKSVAENGWGSPIVVDAKYVIIVGHGRWASQRLKMSGSGRRLRWIEKTPAEIKATKIPVVVATEMSETQARALRIADNRIAENSHWNEDILAAELAALEDAGVDLDVLGFSDEELDKIIDASLEQTTNTAQPEGRKKGAAAKEKTWDQEFMVLIRCDDEAHQRRLLDELKDLKITALTR